MNAPPPMPELCGSTRPSIAWIATAASAALPPAASTSSPASTASGLAAATPTTRASGDDGAVAGGSFSDEQAASKTALPVRARIAARNLFKLTQRTLVLPGQLTLTVGEVLLKGNEARSAVSQYDLDSFASNFTHEILDQGSSQRLIARLL